MNLSPLYWVWLGSVPYGTAWEIQQELANLRANEEIPDTVLLLQHPPVFTMGRNGKKEHLPKGKNHLLEIGAEYFDVDRGGSITFHGPGQLVAYPIVKLSSVFPIPNDPGRGDVITYVRALEQACIETAASTGVSCNRRPPYTGVWVGTDKIAAIGVKLAHGVTLHGSALNVTTNLRWFSHIIPCGIADSGVTSLQLQGATVTVEELANVHAAAIAKAFGRKSEQAGGKFESMIQGCKVTVKGYQHLRNYSTLNSVPQAK